jgi:NAD(P)-dependent dehydrogenase (short-subunit alcohol dehydrogenase family)
VLTVEVAMWDPGVEGKVVLVTGGGRGIGRAVAELFAEHGARVAVCARTTAEIEAVAAGIREAGGEALALECDVRDDASVVGCVASVVTAFGPVEVLVHSAGIAESAPILRMERELWDRTLDTNLTSALRLTTAVLPAMMERGWGRVVHLASIAGKVGQKYISAYCASKHGLIGFVRSVGLEIAKSGVTINAICPGYVDTPMTDDNAARVATQTGRSPDEVRRFMAHTSPQERLIEVGEIAALALYLASHSARGINGQGINVDGGGVTS